MQIDHRFLHVELHCGRLAWLSRTEEMFPVTSRAKSHFTWPGRVRAANAICRARSGCGILRELSMYCEREELVFSSCHFLNALFRPCAVLRFTSKSWFQSGLPCRVQRRIGTWDATLFDFCFHLSSDSWFNIRAQYIIVFLALNYFIHSSIFCVF